MFTPKGLSVKFLVFLILAASSSGVGKVSALKMPSPPALETAVDNSVLTTYCIPP